MFYTYCAVHKGKIIYRYIDDEGKRHNKKVNFKPTFYRPSEWQSKHKSIEGFDLEEKKFDSINDAKYYFNLYKDVKDHEVYGNKNYEYQFIRDNFPDQIEYDSSLIEGHLLDIEVYTPPESDIGFPSASEVPSIISSLAVYSTTRKKMFAFGTHRSQKWTPKNIDAQNYNFEVEYHHFDSEESMLRAYLNWHTDCYPDYMSAWYGDFFDMPYIVNRMDHILGYKVTAQLSPFGFIRHKENENPRPGVPPYEVEIKGVQHLDYMDLYKKHTPENRESYALDYIGEFELKEGKIKYDGNINKLYEDNFQGYIDYNIQDTALLVKLEEKLKLFEITFALSYFARVNYEDTLGTVKIWDVLMYNFLRDDNRYALIKKGGNITPKIPGGFVKDPRIGLSKWITSVDLASLYPSLIRQYNMGQETIVPESQWTEEMSNINSILQDGIRKSFQDSKPELITNKLINRDIKVPEGLVLAANGQFFKKDKQSYLSQAMELLYKGRKIDKRAMLNSKLLKEDILNELKVRNINV